MSVMVWIGVGTSPGVLDHSQTHSSHLRLNFDEDMNNDSQLIDIANYTISGLTTLSVVRVDTNTVDIMFTTQIPSGLTNIDVIGPRDLALNAANGTYSFTAIDNFEMVSIVPLGSHSFLVEFSREPYTEDRGAQSAISIHNWSVSNLERSVAVSGAELASEYSIRHIALTVVEEIFSDSSYSISHEAGIMDSDLTDYADSNYIVTTGYIKRVKRELEIVSGYKSRLPAKRTSRHGSLLQRNVGTGYALRNNADSTMRVICRLIFSSHFYHIDRSLLLGIQPKASVNFKLESMKKAILDVCKSQKEVTSATCSISFSPKDGLLKIVLGIKTKTGESTASISRDSEGMVQYG